MKILVLYHALSWRPQRKAIQDHLFCFQRYQENENEVYYYNVLTKIPSYLTWMKFDAIILHFTLFDMRMSRDRTWWNHQCEILSNVKKMHGEKIAIPQDEYICTEDLCRLFKHIDVHTIYTCADPSLYEVIYPVEKSGIKHFNTTFPGFIDEETLGWVEKVHQKSNQREIDIGYRARKLPYYFGRHGQTKHEIAEIFQKFGKNYPLKMDISTRPNDVFFGDQWIKFLLNCRVIIGCAGGSSLHDVDGSIRYRVEDYLKEHPGASFEEVEESCFKGKEGQFLLSSLSPRHFECALTKSCQVLLEGNYSGNHIFKPNIHYIELKKDYSNLEEVFKQIQDKAFCEEIAERAYKDIILPRKYTYSNFAKKIVSHIEKSVTKKAPPQAFLSTFVKSLIRIKDNTSKLQSLRFRLWFLKHISLPKKLSRKKEQI